MHTSVDFLHKFRPGGPWLLVAVHPEKKVNRLPALTFQAGQEVKLEKWIKAVGKEHNIYFSVNPTKEAMNKKAQRTDIARMEYLHVDVDPAEDKNLEEEQARILQLFRDFKPVPTCIIYSGGGYQAFWKLDEPIQIGGEMALAEDAKRYNMQLEILLGGDNCHNVDRIMRLPGTMNRPDAKKRAKGRKVVEAKLIHFDATLTYPISKFTAAQDVQSISASRAGFLGRSAAMPKISGNIRRLEDVNDLPDSVKPYTKVIIVQGHDPDEPGKFKSRSHALWYVCCELTRAGVSPETIYAVITDKDFGIATSVVELGSRAEAYALKQIKDASEHAEAKELMELNNKHAVIASLGGKCQTIGREWDHAFDRTKIVRQSFGDFSNRYMNRRVKIGTDKNGEPQYMPMGKWWLQHPRREQFDTMVFVPGKETPGAFNLWQGFGCEARPGECGLYLAHVKDNICSGVNLHYEYLLNWMAATVQTPDVPIGVAVVLRGKQGTGKGVFTQTFGYLFGQHFLSVTNSKHLVGNFNNHLRDCVVLFGDEAFYAGDKANEGVLKGLITEKQVLVEPKGVDSEYARNFLHIIMASNSEWVVPVGMDDRRFFMLDVSEARRVDKPYFSAIKDQMKSGGYESLLHLLQTRDITNFDFDSAPKTDALAEQKTLNLTPEESWWHDKLQEGRTLVKHEDWERDVPCEELFLDYVDFVKRPGGKVYQARCTKTRMTRFLKRFCPVGYPTKRELNLSPDPNSPSPGLRFNSKPVCFGFPSLAECRQAWDKLTECKVPWQDVASGEEPPPF